MGLFDKLKKGMEEIAKARPPEAEEGQQEEEVEASEEEECAESCECGGACDETEEDEEQQYRAGLSLGHSDGCGRYMSERPHFGSLDPEDFDAFMFAKCELEDAEMHDNLEAKLSELGFSGKEEWWHIEASFLRRHFAGLSEEEYSQAYMQACLNARNKQTMRNQQQALAADPSLLEPVDGVTVEMWAQASAMLARETDQAKQVQALAKMGMDQAKYAKACTEFQARMQRDTTFALATIYGKAFSSAQGIEGGGGFGAVDGSVQKLGKEPCSFELYCEISGAQAAWGETGADVNANLKKYFDIIAADYSKYASYWSTKFQADVRLMQEWGDKMDQYREKYMEGADQDDDLDV